MATRRRKCTPSSSPITTWFGAVGEGLKASAFVIPPPFNLVALGAGAFSSGIAWFFAKDKNITHSRESGSPHRINGGASGKRSDPD